MRSHFALLMVLLSLFVVGTTVVAGDMHTHPASNDVVAGDRTAVNETATNGTTIRIRPRSNGDAYWNISMEFALHGENETAAFNRLGRDFGQGDVSNGDIGFSAETFRNIAQREQAETGREMQIRSVNPTYSVDNETGTLTLTFIWTNFTRVKDDKIFLGDAFLFDDGESTWLRSLSSNQHLVIESPEGYDIRNSNSGHKNGTITLNGPTPIRSQTGGDPSIQVTYRKDSNPVQKASTPLLTYTAAFLVFVGIMGAGVYAFLQRDDDEPATDTEGTDQQHVSSPPPESAEDEPDVELLSDEERVEHLLEQNGGRMKQASIVKQTNWSNAKVSQLLSAMNEEDRINKLRIGRENLITLPGEDITDFGAE